MDWLILSPWLSENGFIYTHSLGIKWKFWVANPHWELWEYCFSYMLSSESSSPILLSDLSLLIFCLCKWKICLIAVKFRDPFIESICFYWKKWVLSVPGHFLLVFWSWFCASSLIMFTSLIILCVSFCFLSGISSRFLHCLMCFLLFSLWEISLILTSKTSY